MLNSLTNRIRGMGFLATAHWGLYRLAQCFMTLDVSRLVLLEGSSARFTEPTGPSVTFRFLSPEDVRGFAKDATNLLDESHADQLNSGHRSCFAALSEGRLAAYAWYTLHEVDAESNRGRQENSGVAISYPDYMAFMYKGFTHPDFRGRGLYGVMNGLAARSLADRGVTHILSTMDWTNVAARRSCRRLGFKELGRTYRWGWGRWMHTHASRLDDSLELCIGSTLRYTRPKVEFETHPAVLPLR